MNRRRPLILLSLCLAMAMAASATLAQGGATARSPSRLVPAETAPAKPVAASAEAAIIRAHLEAKGTPFTIDEDGDFAITVRISDDRTQLVWVRSAVESTKHMRIREIWSAGYRSDSDAFPAELANDLLARSQLLILGSWVKQGGTAMLVSKIPADAGADQLDEAIDLTAIAADALELELSGTDEL